MALATMLKLLAPNLLKPDSEPLARDFFFAVWVALVLLLLRYIFEKTAIPLLARRLARALDSPRSRADPGDGSHLADAPRGVIDSAAQPFVYKPERPHRANGYSPAVPREAVARSFSVLDSAWVASFAACLACFAWYVTVYHNGGCTPWATHTCFGGWPNHPIALSQRLYMVLAFAYYLYELLGTVLGLGTKLKIDMISHHVVTMMLLLIGYQTNLYRMAVMWQALFDLSNPILHTAKALHASGVRALGPIKWVMFNLFAVTFLVCRVILGPISIVWPSFTTTVGVLPPSYCYTCWTLMVFVQILQMVWFYKIVDIARKGDKGVKVV